ncbi:unnamed protein product [Prunus armeniaca]
MDIRRTSTLSSTTLTSQPLPTVVWITEKSKKLAGFYPKSPLLVRAIPSTIFFDPGWVAMGKMARGAWVGEKGVWGLGFCARGRKNQREGAMGLDGEGKQRRN